MVQPIPLVAGRRFATVSVFSDESRVVQLLVIHFALVFASVSVFSDESRVVQQIIKSVVGHFFDSFSML